MIPVHGRSSALPSAAATAALQSRRRRTGGAHHRSRYAHAIRCRVQLTDNEHDPRGLVTLNDKFIA
jgi:hypothetical protein